MDQLSKGHPKYGLTHGNPLMDLHRLALQPKLYPPSHTSSSPRVIRIIGRRSFTQFR